MTIRQIRDLILEWMHFPPRRRKKLSHLVSKYEREAAGSLWAGYKQVAETGDGSALQQYHRENANTHEELRASGERDGVDLMDQWLAAPAGEEDQLETEIDSKYPPEEFSVAAAYKEPWEEWVGECILSQAATEHLPLDQCMRIAEYRESRLAREDEVYANDPELCVGSYDEERPELSGLEDLPPEPEIREKVRKILAELNRC